MNRPDRLELTFHRDGVFQTAFGLAEMTAGIWVVYACSGQPAPGGDATARWIVSTLVGLVFFLGGAAVALLRSGVWVDRSRGLICLWWGMPYAVWKRVHRLDAFHAVRVCETTYHTQVSLHRHYPVELIGSGKPFSIDAPDSYPAARELAEQIGRFAELEIRDVTGYDSQLPLAVTPDEELDEGSGGGIVPPPPAPPECRISHEVAGEQIVFTLPGPQDDEPLSQCLLTPLFLVPALGLGVYFLVVQPGWLAVLGLVVLLGIGVPLLVSHYRVLKVWTRKEELAISVRNIRVRWRGYFETRSFELPMDRLERIEMDDGVITVCGGSQRFDLGGDLSQQERKWLFDTVRVIVTQLHGNGRRPEADDREQSPVALVPSPGP